MLKDLTPPSWKKLVKEELNLPRFKELESFLSLQYKQETIYPNKGNIFKALSFFKPVDTKVVILGQDPYHGENQAHGLSFSIPKNQKKLPPSLKNIRKEIEQTTKVTLPEHGNLEGWAAQGVLLLNAVLTVEAGKAASHQKKGWEAFTDTLISELSSSTDNIVFLLWGAYAHKKEALIDPMKHLILKSVHPSPLSAHRGFFGQEHFSRANKYLKSHGKQIIDWSTP